MDSGNEDGNSKNPQEHHEDAAGSSGSEHPQEHLEDATGSSRTEHPHDHLVDSAVSSKSDHPQEQLEDAAESSRSEDPRDHLEDLAVSSKSDHPQEQLEDAAESSRSEHPQDHLEDSAVSSKSDHPQEHLEDAAESSRSEHPPDHLEDAAVSSKSDHPQEHLQDAAESSRSEHPQDHLEDAAVNSRSDHPQEHLEDAVGSSRNEHPQLHLEVAAVSSRSDHPQERLEDAAGGSRSEHPLYHLEDVAESSRSDHPQEHLEDAAGGSRSEHPLDHLEDVAESSRSDHPQEHLDDATDSSRSNDPEIIPLDSFRTAENSESIELYPKVIDRSRSSEIALSEGEVNNINGSVIDRGFFTAKFGSFSFSSSSRSLSISSSEDLFQVDTNQQEHLEDAVGSSETALRGEVNNVNGSVTGGGFFTEKFRSFSFSSSRSLSISSSEDLFQADTNPFNPNACVSFSHKPNEGSKPVLECDIRPPGTSSCQVSDSNRNPETHSMSPTQTPPIQIMDRSEGQNPSRIPHRVFESNSSPMEWSAASNDSLFSLHLGKSVDFENSSIEIDKSGGPHSKSGAFINLNKPTPVPASEPALGIDRKSVEIVKNSEPNRVVDEPIIDATKKPAEEQKQNQVKQELQPQVVSLNSPGSLSHSDASSSSHSLAIPTTNKKKKSKCSFCYCALPKCYVRWPNCYFPDCTWVFSYSRKRLCCCNCIWTGKSKDSAYQEDLGKPTKHQPLQQHPSSESPSPKAHPKSSAYKCPKCFPCFYSCGRCSCYRFC